MTSRSCSVASTAGRATFGQLTLSLGIILTASSNPQPAKPSNAMGIGKWAQTPTAAGAASAAAQAHAIAIAQGHVPKGSVPTPVAAATTTKTEPQTGRQPTPTQTTEYLPPSRPGANSSVDPSTLPVQTAPPSHPQIDPTKPSGLIPSSNQSTYQMDVSMFESANLPWRRPGADISDWFNYGFDEVSWRTFLTYRAEMERGRESMVSVLIRVKTLMA